MDSWKEFSAKTSPTVARTQFARKNPARLTSKRLSLNAFWVRDEGLDKKNRVRVFYNESRKEVALQFVESSETDGTISFRQHPNTSSGGAYMVASNQFVSRLEEYGYPLKSSLPMLPKKIDTPRGPLEVYVIGKKAEYGV